MDELDQLNPQQHKAVTADDGQVLVLAGPGSGKTRVLTYRAAYLIRKKGVPPYNILAVTFTNKAASEMKTRLESLVNEPVRDIWLGTFHAMCARLLRREAQYLPFTSNFVILDSDDQQTLVKRALRELNIDEKVHRPASIHAAISFAKNNLQGPRDLPNRSYRDEIVIRVYERYEQLLVENNGVDFDDLLMLAVKLLRENSEVCCKYARRFEHVLVDEFQDTNVVQYELLRLLSSQHHNLYVVGDEDQSIYRWRGADYRNVLRFEKDYPRCHKILLEENYRSTQNVLDVARSVIDRNANRTRKKLFSERGAGNPILLYEAADDRSEAGFVVETIQQWLQAKKAQGGDYAIMYRTNAQSRLIEEAFLAAGLPYRLVGAQRFYGRREVKDIIAYLRLAQNPKDELSLVRVVSVPPRGIGDKTILNLQQLAQNAGLAPGEVLLDLGRKGSDSPYWEAFGGRSSRLLADFGSLLDEWNRSIDKVSLPALFDRIVTDIGYQRYLENSGDEDQERWGNVVELRRLAFEYQEQGLTPFLENLALVSDQDTLPEQSNVPTLLTLHAAKGLEFSRVFIVGLDEGLLPHSRSRDDPEEMAEERRLFYVGITRTKDQLYLVRADRRSSFGEFEFSQPSRFLDDIPDKLLKREGARAVRRTTYSWNSFSSTPVPTTTRPPAEAKPLPEPRYRAGMRIRHAGWGEGMVIDSRVQDDGEEVLDVAFESVGLKRLLASLAKLEILQK